MINLRELFQNNYIIYVKFSSTSCFRSFTLVHHSRLFYKITRETISTNILDVCPKTMFQNNSHDHIGPVTTIDENKALTETGVVAVLGTRALQLSSTCSSSRTYNKAMKEKKELSCIFR